MTAQGFILAVTDLSVESEQALFRSVLLAVQHRAPLRFMYLAGGSRSHFSDPQARLMQRCRALGRQHHILIEAVENVMGSLKSVKAEARNAHVLVMHHSLGGKLGGFAKRSVVDRLLREAGCPVLMVKGPVAEPYRHVMVALDLKTGSEDLLPWWRIARPPTKISVFHALDNQAPSAATLAMPGQAHPSLDERRTQERQRAQKHLRQLVDLHIPTNQPAEIFVDYGEPARGVVSRQSAGLVNLIVLGKRQATYIDDVLQRSTGHKVLTASSCDVLISPRPPVAPSQFGAGGQEVAWI